MRLPSAVLGTACIPLVYAVGSVTLGEASAAALLAFSGYHVFWSQVARIFAMECSLGLSATALLLWIARSPRPKRLHVAVYAALMLAVLSAYGPRYLREYLLVAFILPNAESGFFPGPVPFTGSATWWVVRGLVLRRSLALLTRVAFHAFTLQSKPALALAISSGRRWPSRSVWRYCRVDIGRFASEVQRAVRPDNLVFVHGNWSNTPILYYLDPEHYRLVGRDYAQACRDNPRSRVTATVRPGRSARHRPVPRSTIPVPELPWLSQTFEIRTVL
jgi:hypothetical protein